MVLSAPAFAPATNRPSSCASLAGKLIAYHNKWGGRITENLSGLPAMNRQPFQTPPRYWPPQLSRWWVRFFRRRRRRVLRRQQRIVGIDVQDGDHLRRLLDQGVGIMITPNHSFHYDSYVLFEAADRIGTPLHIMTAWQVFAMSSWLERWSLQKHGCFSIDRESNDLQAFRLAVRILQEKQHPLVIFPEGEIYHTNDWVNPFREGAAAIALTAARKGNRSIFCLPCAMKCFYVDDPVPELLRLMDRLEERLMWRPRHDLSLPERVYRLAQGIVSLKELEYVGKSRRGGLRERCDHLADVILTRQEHHYELKNDKSAALERVRELRRTLIERMGQVPGQSPDAAQIHTDMDDLFFVTQLYSYPGNYLREKLTLERLAETMDKLEEDLLQSNYPAVRGTRRVVVRFGEPVSVTGDRHKREAVPLLTQLLQDRVQQLLDDLKVNSAEHPDLLKS
jgi:1-acyl-sn-glycerol-3-phosphate acyltransferase